MKAISQHPFAAQEQRGHFPLARSRSLALRCCESLSLSCLCLTASRREARRLGTGADLVPNNSASSLLASSRRSFERNVTLTQDSSQRSSPSESSPSHSTRRPRRRSTSLSRHTQLASFVSFQRTLRRIFCTYVSSVTKPIRDSSQLQQSTCAVHSADDSYEITTDVSVR